MNDNDEWEQYNWKDRQRQAQQAERSGPYKEGLGYLIGIMFFSAIIITGVIVWVAS